MGRLPTTHGLWPPGLSVSGPGPPPSDVQPEFLLSRKAHYNMKAVRVGRNFKLDVFLYFVAQLEGKEVKSGIVHHAKLPLGLF